MDIILVHMYNESTKFGPIQAMTRGSREEGPCNIKKLSLSV